MEGYGKEAATIATAWGWKSSDITDKRVRTHSEEYRDYPNWYHRNNGTHYRWDLNGCMLEIRKIRVVIRSVI